MLSIEEAMKTRVLLCAGDKPATWAPQHPDLLNGEGTGRNRRSLAQATLQIRQCTHGSHFTEIPSPLHLCLFAQKALSSLQGTVLYFVYSFISQITDYKINIKIVVTAVAATFINWQTVFSNTPQFYEAD